MVDSTADWVERYGDILYRFALARCRNPEVAEDLVQETFLAGLRARQNFRDGSSLQTWLIGILKHKIIDHFRSRKWTISLDNAPEGHNADGEITRLLKLPLKEWNASPEKALENQAFRRALNQCLDSLPETWRELFLMREMDEMESAELCNIFKVSPTNLRVILYRARMQLRGCLEKNWFRN